MVAFYLGMILGALGGFLFLFLLSMVVQKDQELELTSADFGKLPTNRAK